MSTLVKQRLQHLHTAYQDWIELTKFRLLSMVLLVTGASYLLADPAHVSYSILLYTLLGTLLLGASAHIFNQFLEIESDRKMDRTKHRPLPANKVSEESAEMVGYLTAIAGLLVLYFGVGTKTAICGILTHISYVLIYTPLKKYSILNTWFGAIPGALPILIGWSAAKVALNDKVIYLFLVLLIWQIPHFLAISWKYKDDYLKGGLRMLSSNDDNGLKTSINMVLHASILVALPIYYWYSPSFNNFFLAGNLLLSGVFVGTTMLFFAKKTLKSAMLVFIFSILYLPLQLTTFLF